MKFLYLDTSASLKLFVREPQSAPLEEWLISRVPDRQITSHLTRTEVRRGLHGLKAPESAHMRAHHWLERTAHVALPAHVFDSAGELAPDSALRSLDAIHVAAAASLSKALACFVTYDKRQAAAAEAEGMNVVSPGLTD
ncbi:type II toxin-antitoxin system VapC family toxin [Glycomyces halotolerans]